MREATGLKNAAAKAAEKSVLMLLRLYKQAVSPLLPAACRYVPTCSEYAMDAVELHGAARGTLKAAWRVLRCHPLARGGYDPVESALGRRLVALGGDGRPRGSTSPTTIE